MTNNQTPGPLTARAKIVAQILTDNGQPVTPPDEATLDDVEWERWNVCLQIVQALGNLKSGKSDETTKRVVRHKKRGTLYTVLGTAELQMATDLVDGAFLTIYQGEDGKWWARQEDEFEDGRFEDIANG